MADRIRTIFLSSTARDLSAYRDAAYRAINGIDGFKCVGMEDFGARDAQADDFCREKIGECDAAVFIVGLCHGSAPKGSRRSYTEQEYEAATEAGVPRLVFLSKDGTFYQGYYRESDRAWKAQQAFRRRVSKERIREEFATPEELATKVTQALANWTADNPERPTPAAGPVVRATVNGSGSIAQGNGAVAAGAGGVAVGGDVHGNVSIVQPPPTTASESSLRESYLRGLMEHCGYLSLAGIDPAVAAQRESDTRLSLDAVYTALLTLTRVYEPASTPRATPPPLRPGAAQPASPARASGRPGQR
jgi:hypothetical protein